LAIALSILGSIAITVAMFGMQPGPWGEIWELIVQSGYLSFLYNWLPVILVVMLLHFALNSTIAACGITGFAVCVLSIINRNMINYRQDPFKPNDILLGGEFFGIAKSIDAKAFILLGMIVFAFVAAFIIGLTFFKNKKAHPAYRAIGTLATAAALLLVNKHVLASQIIYSNLQVRGNIYNLTDNYQSKGFLYSFINTLDNSKITKPVNYDKDSKEIAKISEEFKAPDFSSSYKPNIVLVLSEAFSDMLDSPLIDYSNYGDPLQNFKAVARDSIFGYLVVPNVGGGTSDTEFDIFTGMNSRHFRGAPYAYSLIAKDTPALPTILKEAGYSSLAIHPGYGWFYNRQNVYPHMGFPGLLDIREFDETDTKGMYVTERQTIEKIIAEYDLHMAENPNTPFFEFCATIQNHGPYYDKYLESSLNFETTADLSDASVNAMYNYIYGLRDCDIELKNLTTYFDTRDEPIILIYYGDHLPSFEKQIYDTFLPLEGDPAKDITRLYKTPFIIWQNSSANQNGILDKAYEDLDPQGSLVISSSYLGALIAHLLGFDKADPFFAYVSELSQDYPVVLESQYVTPDGTLETLDGSIESPLSFYKSWEHYRIFEGTGN
jgi:phosphoglycerol transferase MdoB-like AlkP superfamily enzyme